MEAMIIVASLLWLPSDTGQLISSVAAKPVAAATTTTIAATTESTEDAIDVMDATTTTTKAAKRKTSGAAQFSVQMILPFSKSTIRYSYTEPSGSATSARTPVQTADVDQAHSMSVSPYGCDSTTSERGTGGQRKRKRLRWKTTTTGAVQTNTVMPLPGYPTNDRGRGMVFEAAAEQLDQLYTVSRVDAAAGSTADDGEASGEGGTTDSAADGTAKR
ncbi:hypothetical protein AGLY_009164 [Aphis glycines]|uniref:Uncharacterized protein n=1 Tax=Aphis glycines TaxID=307491 RepID=A0A6G0TII5_APHGL|nr:hypothetical protein AGLY_009164 [Aphis glycines]